MRMWMVDPSLMCRKHLLGEHVELHMLVAWLVKGRSIAGWVASNCMEPKMIKQRHEALERIEYHKKNIERENNASRQYRLEHKDEFIAYMKIYSSTRAYKDKRNMRAKEKHNNINYKISHGISCNIRHSLSKLKKGQHWETLVGYTLEDLMNHLKGKFTEGMTWENYGDYKGRHSGWQIDHIIPLSNFNITSCDCEDFKKCWSLENLQPLWATTRVINGVEYLGNVNKGNKIIK